FWRHGDRGRFEPSLLAVGREPFSGNEVMAAGLAQPEQHELFAAIDMQRQPVPSGLIGSERLAAPFAIHPGKARHLDRSVVDGDMTAGLEIRLAVVIGGLALR